MATNIFSLKTKDTNHYIYFNMLGQHIADSFIDAHFIEDVPTNGDKAVCYKTMLGYTMRNAALYFDINPENPTPAKINKVVIELAICSKTNYVTKPSYTFNSADKNNWNDSCVEVRKEKIGNRYTTYFRVTLTDGTPNDCTTCSIRFQTNGVFVYDAYVEYEYEGYITLSPTSANVPKEGSTETLKITSNVDWTVTSDQTWCIVSPESGTNSGEVMVTVAENSITTPRTAYVKVKNPSVHDEVMTITQSAADPILKFTPSSVLIDFNSSEIPCSLESNIEWYVSSGDDWLSYFPTAGSNNAHITIHADKNFDAYTRSGSVTVGNRDFTVSDTISVTQGAFEGYVTLSPTSANVPKEGSTETLKITSNVDWTVTSDQTWCIVSPESGTDSGEVTVAVAENSLTTSRTANVKVKSQGLQDEVMTITQYAADPRVKVTPSAVLIDFNSSEIPCSVESNIEWYVSADDRWLIGYPTGSANNAPVTIHVDKNFTDYLRYAVVIVGNREGTVSDAIAVTQSAYAGPTLSVSPSIIQSDANGTQQTVDVFTNKSWSVSKNQNWVSITPSASGTNDGRFTVTIDTNPDVTQRTATITVTTNTGENLNISVTQDASVAPTE